MFWINSLHAAMDERLIHWMKYDMVAYEWQRSRRRWDLERAWLMQLLCAMGTRDSTANIHTDWMCGELGWMTASQSKRIESKGL